MHRLFACCFLLAGLSLLAASPARAYCFSPAVTNVQEYYDATSDRYFMAWEPDACVMLQPPHLAPASTLPTALTWRTYNDPQQCSLETPSLCAYARPICEFVKSNGLQPASVLITINAGECAALKQPGSGWTYVPMTSTVPGSGDASMSAFEIDPSTGRCAASLVPVYRFVNNGFPTDRVNHRYVADESVRTQMHSRPGWTEEGIAFCVLSGSRAPIQAAYLDLQAPGEYESIAPIPCRNGIGRTNSCVESTNMPALSAVQGPFNPANFVPYVAFTGIGNDGYLETIPGAGPNPGAHSFAQVFSGYGALGAGFFLTSVDRTAGYLSSISTRNVQFPDSLPFLGRPFAAGYEVDMDLVVDYRLFVKRVRAAGDGNEAYVQPLVTFIDSSSGHRLVLSPGAMGTVPMTDIATVDAASGNALVAIALGAQTSVGRSVGLPSLRTPKTFDADNPWGWGGEFVYRVNRTDFARVIAMARTVDPALGVDPSTYGIESYGLKGEVAGRSDIGYHVEEMQVSLVRP